MGAGLAGLSCARALSAAGVSVVVLEARDRVGGRTFSKTLGKGTFDVGGQWIGPTQNRAIALAKELGADTFPTFATGRKVLDLDGIAKTYSGIIPKLLPHRLLDLHLAIRRIDAEASKIALANPAKTGAAARLDAETLESWKLKNVRSRAVRELLDATVRVVFGAEPGELSLLHFLFYVRSGGNLMRLVEIEGGAQQWRFVNGAQSLSSGLAKILGEKVILSTPVRRIVQEDGAVRVASDALELRARRVVVAVPPALAVRIEFTPQLPPSHDQRMQRTPMGATVKCITLYDRPFWRDAGLSGEVVSNTGPASVVFDNTSHDGKQAALLSFVVGKHAKGWSSRGVEERRNAVLGQLARLFGPEAARPTLYEEHDWATEAWTRGCPVGLLPPGTLTAFGDGVRAPVGAVHWAGTETAIEWHGFMEGALESGERAAREVMARLVKVEGRKLARLHGATKTRASRRVIDVAAVCRAPGTSPRTAKAG